MRQSNGYTVIFAVIVCVVIGGSLAVVYEMHKGLIADNKANEKRVNIMSAVTTVSASSPKEIESLYNKSVKSLVVNPKGEVITERDGAPVVAEEVDVLKQFKAYKDQMKKGEDPDILLPVFKYVSEVDTTKFEAYVFPVYGAGLWDAIWGYVAVSGDFKTIKGVVFDHTGETPGLGARITNNKDNTGSPNAFQERFVGKSFWNFDDSAAYPIEVVKGEGVSIEGEAALYKIDGLSGASMTTQGLNKMLSSYFKLYGPFIAEEIKKSAGDGEQTLPPPSLDNGNMVSVQ